MKVAANFLITKFEEVKNGQNLHEETCLGMVTEIRGIDIDFEHDLVEVIINEEEYHNLAPSPNPYWGFLYVNLEPEYDTNWEYGTTDFNGWMPADVVLLFETGSPKEVQ